MDAGSVEVVGNYTVLSNKIITEAILGTTTVKVEVVVIPRWPSESTAVAR